MAVCMVVFTSIMGGLLIYGVFFEAHEGEDIRRKHLEQHADEQIKYDRMIELLEEIDANTKVGATKPAPAQ